jgi:hypothetical protein
MMRMVICLQIGDGIVEKLHIEELCGLYSSPSIIRIIKSRRMRLAGHVARMEGEEHVEVNGGKEVARKTTK